MPWRETIKRSKSSRNWLKEHFDDEWVARAKAEGYRSRASYKLLEIDDKDKLFRPGMCVLDLGAAPGGWSQVAAERCKGKGRLIASDILPMDVIADVDFVQGDFREQEVFDAIMEKVGNQPVDLVMSDMAPNISGNKAVDQPRVMYLCELALDLATQVLAPKGHFLVKLFQGEGSDAYRQEMKQRFRKVVTRKPAASRARSREVYVLASGLK